MDEMPQVQNAQNAQSENQQPVSAQIDQLPMSDTPKETGKIRKIFNASSWFVLFAFLPVTVLIFLSQNTVPGEMFYPVKRSMENVILAAAAVSPATRVAFRTDLTTRRFDEAEKLLLASSDTKGLKDFVTGIQTAQKEVSAISDPAKKQELQQKIQTSVIEYERRLDLVRAQLVTREQTTQLTIVPTLTPTNSQTVSQEVAPTAIPLPTNTPVPVPTSKPGQPIIPTNTPVPLPTSTPKPLTPSRPPSATPTPIPPTNAPTQVQIQGPTVTPKQTPTSTPIPSFTPTPTPTPPQSKGGGTIGTVDRVQEYLRCLKTTLPPHSECVPPDIDSASSKSEDRSESFNLEDQPEKQNQEKSKRDEKHEKKEKNNH